MYLLIRLFHNKSYRAKFIDINGSKYILEEYGNGYGSTYEIYAEKERLYMVHQLSGLDNGHSHSHKYYFNQDRELYFVYSIIDLFNYTGGEHLYRELRICFHENEIIKVMEKKINSKDIEEVRTFKVNIDNQPNQEIDTPDLPALANANLLLNIWHTIENLKRPF